LSVKGNHDEVFFKILRDDKPLRKKYKREYGNSMENLLEQDHDDLAEWISSLPEKIVFPEHNLMACHGTPWNLTGGYVYPDSALDEFAEYPQQLFLLGHTHYPMCRNLNKKTIVNPGSIGQPRNGDWPSYAVIDCEKIRVDFRKVIYDKKKFISNLDQLNNQHNYLRKVIER